MPIPFRPRLEALDARDLPSVTPFSFTLGNGTLVSGSFDYADPAVDPALASQQVPISDLIVALNGQATTLPVQLSAPAATFVQGQLQGVALTAVAVAGDMAAFIGTAGMVAPILVSVPAPVVNPITPPVPGVGPIDRAAAIASYDPARSDLIRLTAGPSILDGRSEVLQTLMNQHDYWSARRDEAFDLLAVEPNPAQQVILRAWWESAKAEVLAVEGELFNAYVNYQTLYQNVRFQYQLLLNVLPPDQRADLLEPPAQFFVPDEYYEDYLSSIV